MRPHLGFLDLGFPGLETLDVLVKTEGSKD